MPGAAARAMQPADEPDEGCYAKHRGPGGEEEEEQVLENRSLDNKQVFAIWFTQLVQGLIITLPYTIAVFMVRHYERAAGRPVSSTQDEQRVSGLTGLLAAYFQAAGVLTSFLLGKLSDMVGRKPVLLVGNVACTCSLVAFGMAQTYSAAALARFMGGLLNGVIGALKTIIGESCGPQGQAKALGYMSLAWGMGTILGPAIGGVLAEPCVRFGVGFPLCAEGQAFQTRPYLLPCLVAAAFGAAATFTSAVLLQESLPSKAAARVAKQLNAGSGGGGNLTKKSFKLDVAPVSAANVRRSSGDDSRGSGGGGRGGVRGDGGWLAARLGAWWPGRGQRQYLRLATDEEAAVGDVPQGAFSKGLELVCVNSLEEEGDRGSPLQQWQQQPCNKAGPTPLRGCDSARSLRGSSSSSGGASSDAGGERTVEDKEKVQQQQQERAVEGEQARRPGLQSLDSAHCGNGWTPQEQAGGEEEGKAAAQAAGSTSWSARLVHNHQHRRLQQQRLRSKDSVRSICDGNGKPGCITVSDDSGAEEEVEGSETRGLLAAAAPAGGGGAQHQSKKRIAWYRIPLVQLTLVGYGCIACIYSFLDEILPLFASAPRSEGGLEWPPDQLAMPLSFGGLVLVAYALLGYPRVQRCLGPIRCARIGLLATLAPCLLPPCASLLHGSYTGEQAVMFAATAAKSLAGCTCFTACMVLVNMAAPLADMGAVNGIGQTIAAAVRALGPAMAGLAWGASLGLPFAGHQFVPFVAVGVAAVLTQFMYIAVRRYHPHG